MKSLKVNLFALLIAITSNQVTIFESLALNSSNGTSGPAIIELKASCGKQIAGQISFQVDNSNILEPLCRYNCNISFPEIPTPICPAGYLVKNVTDGCKVLPDFLNGECTAKAQATIGRLCKMNSTFNVITWKCEAVESSKGVGENPAVTAETF